jgi:hypothetical protein
MPFASESIRSAPGKGFDAAHGVARRVVEAKAGGLSASPSLAAAAAELERRSAIL